MVDPQTTPETTQSIAAAGLDDPEEVAFIVDKMRTVSASNPNRHLYGMIVDVFYRGDIIGARNCIVTCRKKMLVSVMQ